MEIHIRIFPPNTKRWSEKTTAHFAMQKCLDQINRHVAEAFITRKAFACGAQGFMDSDGNVCCLIEINATLKDEDEHDAIS